MYRQMDILHSFQCEVLHWTASLKVKIKSWIWKISNFVFIFVYNMPSLTQSIPMFLNLAS